MLEGRAADARAAADDALARAQDLEGTAVFVAALHRQRGWSFLQSGDADAAREAFAESLAVARSGGENYGLISNEYEVALTLDALARAERLAGNDPGGHEAERDAILTRLGVVRLSQPPVAG